MSVQSKDKLGASVLAHFAVMELPILMRLVEAIREKKELVGTSTSESRNKP